MSFNRRRFLQFATLSGLAAAAPALALALARDGGRGTPTLSLSFSSFPGVGRLGGGKLADAIWSNARVTAHAEKTLAVQLLAARFEGNKPVAGFASPLAKFTPDDNRRTLAKILPSDMYLPGESFLPADLYLPGDMYLPEHAYLPAHLLARDSGQLFSAREAENVLGAPVADEPGFRPKGLVLFAFALVAPGAGIASRALVFELDRK